MASLQELKSRLSSVETTKKITKAMQLVATAKLQKARKNLNFIQEYYTSVYQMFEELISNIKDVSKLNPKFKNDSQLFIVITSDIGLCGGYNSNIIKMLKGVFRPNKDEIIVLGNKGISAAKTNDWNMLLKFPHIGDEPFYQFSADIAKESLAQYFAGNISAIKVVFTKFINTVTFEPNILQILPIKQKENSSSEVKKIKSLIDFEPSPEEVFKSALPIYVSAIIFGATIESKVSEMSSRRSAMENATDNATELIETLDLEYNRIRQSSITQEITEIVAGAEV